MLNIYRFCSCYLQKVPNLVFKSLISQKKTSGFPGGPPWLDTSSNRKRAVFPLMSASSPPPQKWKSKGYVCKHPESSFHQTWTPETTKDSQVWIFKEKARVNFLSAGQPICKCLGGTLLNSWFPESHTCWPGVNYSNWAPLRDQFVWGAIVYSGWRPFVNFGNKIGGDTRLQAWMRHVLFLCPLCSEVL